MAIPKGNSKCDTCHVAPGWSFMHAELQVQANNNCTMGGMAVPRMTNKKVHNLSVWEWDRANFFFLISFTQKKKENYFDVFVYLVLPQGRRKKKMKKKKKVVRTKIPAFVALDHTQLLIDNTRGPHRLASSPGTSHFPSTRDLPLRFSRYFQYLVPNFSLPFFFSLLPIYFFLFVSVIIPKNPEIYTKITFKF